jgi:hypothetical protein
MAKQLTRLEVTHNDGRWIVRELGIGRLTSHQSQQDATKAARAVAANHTPSDLTIRNEDGSLNSEESFPRI